MRTYSLIFLMLLAGCSTPADDENNDIITISNNGPSNTMSNATSNTPNNAMSNATSNATNNASNSNATNNETSNSTNNMTIPMGPPRYVLIQDESFGSGCGSNLPGADLFGATLDRAGVAGWARVVDFELGTGNNDFGDPTIRDGQPTDIDCLQETWDFTAIFSLGCGGWAVLEFVDVTDGTTLELMSGDTVHIYENHMQCYAEDNPDDRYDIFLCDDPVVPASGEWTCVEFLGDGPGEVLTTL